MHLETESVNEWMLFYKESYYTFIHYYTFFGSFLYYYRCVHRRLMMLWFLYHIKR
ncbi:hypothetical protein BD770DRAFT_390164 [Pilaira anomala]|nr:hypothetical protein BD770DRAFT_390164 [Pilaira anomala]